MCLWVFLVVAIGGGLGGDGLTCRLLEVTFSQDVEPASWRA